MSGIDQFEETVDKMNEVLKSTEAKKLLQFAKEQQAGFIRMILNIVHEEYYLEINNYQDRTEIYVRKQK